MACGLLRDNDERQPLSLISHACRKWGDAGHGECDFRVRFIHRSVDVGDVQTRNLRAQFKRIRCLWVIGIVVAHRDPVGGWGIGVGSESHQIAECDRQIRSCGLNLKQERITAADATSSIGAVGVIYRCGYVLIGAHDLCLHRHSSFSAW